MISKALARKLAKSRVLRFIFSAGAGFLVDISAFHLFYHYIFKNETYQIFSFTLGNYTLCLAISFFLGVVVNFLITRYAVFKESKLKPSTQFMRFASVAVVGYFANLAIIRLLIHTFHVYADIARITAALSLFFASYFVHKVFSFSLSLRNHES